MISRFNDHQTPEYRAVVRALRALSASDASRAYAEATATAVLENFRTTRGIRQRAPSSHVCVDRLKGRRQCPGYSAAYSDNKMKCPEIPDGDHLSEWTVDGKTVAILSQPYGLTYRGLVETVQFCQENDLEVLVNTYPSFHYPGIVLSLIFTQKGFRLKPVELENQGAEGK